MERSLLFSSNLTLKYNKLTFDLFDPILFVSGGIDGSENLRLSSLNQAQELD